MSTRRWHHLPDPRELGAVEVARPFRGAGIANYSPSNFLIARVGSRAPQASRLAFEAALFAGARS